jgi:hypothetical protein
VADLLRRLSGARAGRGTLWYRGHANYEWRLVPRVARKPGFFMNELDMLKRDCVGLVVAQDPPQFAVTIAMYRRQAAPAEA